ncbi:MAG TPA: hypothetical protein VE075_03100, partial [Thermoanaerobaculia bacterium]|nr:hypothetical protein [Thermoanaerobaculia bacterium]
MTAHEEEAAAAPRHQPRRVWVVPQLREGRIARVSWEAVAAAQRLAAALGEIDELPRPGAAPAPAPPSPNVARVEAVLLGQGLDGAARELAQRDLAAVHVADHPALAAYTPGAWIGVLAPALAAASPDFVLFPHTYQTVDFVPRLAQRAGTGLLPEVTGFSAAGGGLVWTRPVLGGKLQARVRVRGAGTVLVSVQ